MVTSKHKVVTILKQTKHFLYVMYRFIRRVILKLHNKTKRAAFHLFPSLVNFIDSRSLRKTIEHHYDFIFNSSGKPRIALILQDGTIHPKSSAFIRLFSPLVIMSKQKHLMFELYNESIKYSSLAGCDLIVVQRTALQAVESANKLVDFSGQNKIPFVFDTDDAFHVINPTHPEYKSQQERLNAMRVIWENAAEVWLSTQTLSDEFSELGNKRRVFTNTIDKQIWRNLTLPIKTPSADEPLQIVYMGTATHDADFKVVLQALENIASSQPGSFELTVIGVGNDIPDHEWITRIYQPRGGSIYPKFVEWFQQQGPFDIGIAPLADSDFNRSKSDIKCLDYLAAGIDPIVSDVTAYETPGLTPFITRVKNSSEAWERALLEQIENKTKNRVTREARMKKAHHYIINERSTEALADKMYERIVALTKQK